VANTFIDMMLEHTKTYESPGSFWRWSAYASIAGVLRDNVYRAQGEGKVYPNIYVLFLAKSGARKGAPVEFCESLLTNVNNTKIISGRTSIQGLMDELARGETDPTTGKVLKSGSAIFIAPELAAGIVGDPEAIKILTDVYDYKANPYKNRLRTGPCFNVDKIVLTMLGASNKEMIKEFFDIQAKKGGMLARTFLVVPNERRPPNSFMYEDRVKLDLSHKEVFKAFQEIAKLKGEMKLTDDAKQEYHDWYIKFVSSMDRLDKDESGAAARIHVGVLKVSMLLAANELTYTIEKEHVERAIEDCMSLLPNYKAFIMGDGKSTIAAAGDIILPEMLFAKEHKLSRKQILRDHWQDIDAETLDKLVITLEAGGLIRQCAAGSEIWYQLTEMGFNVMNGEGPTKQNAKGV
jgi:hypothetical protein